MYLLSLARYMPCSYQLPLLFFYGVTAHIGPRNPPPKHILTLTIRLLSTCGQPGTEVDACTTHNKDRRTSMLSAWSEPVVVPITRLQTYALNRVATEFGPEFNYQCLVYTVPYGVRNYANLHVFLKLRHSTYYWE